MWVHDGLMCFVCVHAVGVHGMYSVGACASKGQADNMTIPGCAAGAKKPHLDCAVKTDALPGAASENPENQPDISRALKEHCSLESAGLI